MKPKKMVNFSLALVGFMLFISTMSILTPFIFGGSNSFTVLSGSMRPTLKPGDVVFVAQTDNPEVGDILTINVEDYVYTHRLVEVLVRDGMEYYVLKGDANPDPDGKMVTKKDIIGKVTFILPLNFISHDYGFSLLIVLPALSIILIQLNKIHMFIKKKNKKELILFRKKSKNIIDTTTILLLVILIISTSRVLSPGIYATSSSYYSDKERGIGSFITGLWEIDAEIEFNPPNLNLKSQGQWVKCRIHVDYNPEYIFPETVLLERLFFAQEPRINGDFLEVKFDRKALEEYLINEGYEKGDVVELKVEGILLDGVEFEGSGVIMIVNG